MSTFRLIFNRLGLSSILDRYTIQHLDNNKNFNHDVNYLQQILDTTGKSILLAYDRDPWGADLTTYVDKLLEHFNPRVKILTSDINQLFLKNKNTIYFPFAYFYQRSLENFQTNEKKYRFSFLSSQSRFHRLYLYQKVKEYITDDDCFAVNLTNIQNQHGFIRNDSIRLTGQNIDVLTDLPYRSISADDSDDLLSFYKSSSVDQQIADYTNKHNAFNSMFNITGESNFDNDIVFFSEKTWKPIQSRCIMLNLGNPGATKCLQQLGFNINKDLDPDLSVIEKIDHISNLMSKLTQADCQEIYQINSEMLDYNYQLFYSNTLLEYFVNYIHEQSTQ